MMAHAVSLDDIRIAEAALDGVVLQTPLLENPDVNAMLGASTAIMTPIKSKAVATKTNGGNIDAARIAALTGGHNDA